MKCTLYVFPHVLQQEPLDNCWLLTSEQKHNVVSIANKQRFNGVFFNLKDKMSVVLCCAKENIWDVRHHSNGVNTRVKHREHRRCPIETPFTIIMDFSWAKKNTYLYGNAFFMSSSRILKDLRNNRSRKMITSHKGMDGYSVCRCKISTFYAFSERFSNGRWIVCLLCSS